MYAIMGREYDIIYIDGDHHSHSVLEDAILSWPLLKKGGIMIFDDYMWNDIKSIDSPHIGINSFITCYRGMLDILHVGYQVFIRKK
jgi:predicted O-methyltransferase YrrM